ncbi:protein transport protein Sec24-like [Iris pallida]|uniref:Protein transport protein Sec24-like n=1 Tax=Iris pallida TaxID=29817 RepID=A0AAX6HTV8_IRIPA|nr:protein transport protein Sec24-like [Iris pallida]
MILRCKFKVSLMPCSKHEWLSFSALRHSLQTFQFLQIQELQTLVIKD